jgi:arsenite-transporting ATPase
MNMMKRSLSDLQKASKQLILIGGKGGVGKTTCAAAIALRLAASGKRTLILSSDPTPSLSDIFEITIGAQETLIPHCTNLSALEISSEIVREQWKDRFGREIYDVVSSFADLDYDFVLDYVGGAPGIEEEYMLYFIMELVTSWYGTLPRPDTPCAFSTFLRYSCDTWRGQRNSISTFIVILNGQRKR